MLGATYLGAGRCNFTVWAPLTESVQVKIPGPLSRDRRVSAPDPSDSRLVGLERLDRGYHSTVANGIAPGMRYAFCFDGKERPDPASRLQPDGVHGPSQVIDPKAFPWDDADWRGLSLDDYIIYEIHVGTFTAQGRSMPLSPIWRKYENSASRRSN